MQGITKQQRGILFRCAILLSGHESIGNWAASHGHNKSHVYHVLAGLTSERVELEIEKLISTWFGHGRDTIALLGARLEREQASRTERGGAR